MAGLGDLAAGLRLAGGAVSPGVFQQVGREDEQARELAQRMQIFQAQQGLQRERLGVEREGRQDARTDMMLRFKEGLAARFQERELAHMYRMSELESRNASAEAKAAETRAFNEWQTKFKADAQREMVQLTASLRQPQVDPLVEIADPSSPTGRRYQPRSQASGQPAPAPAGGASNTRKADEQANAVDLTNQLIDEAETLIKNNSGTLTGVVGPKGMLGRGVETVKGTVDPGAPTPAIDFKNKTNAIIAIARKAISTDTNLSNQDRQRLEEIAGGGVFTTDSSALKALADLRRIVGRNVKTEPKDDGYEYRTLPDGTKQRRKK